MHSRSKKLLVILLTLLLGLSPVQGAMAELTSLAQPMGHAHQLVDTQDDNGIDDNQPFQESGQFDTDTGSTNTSCLSGHCAACAMVLTQAPILSTIYTSKPLLLQVTGHFTSPPSASLFRPPRS
jgi:hypothetical protein